MQHKGARSLRQTADSGRFRRVRGWYAAETTILDRRQTPDGLADSQRFNRFRVLCVTLFSNPYRLSQKVTWVFMSYILWYILCIWIVSHVLSYSYVLYRRHLEVIWSHGFGLCLAFTIGLRLTISWLVSMPFVLCSFLRILEDMSSLRILIILEEPPHLTLDLWRLSWYLFSGNSLLNPPVGVGEWPTA